MMRVAFLKTCIRQTIALLLTTTLSAQAETVENRIQGIGRIAYQGFVALNKTDRVNSFTPSRNAEFLHVISGMDNKTIFLMLSIDWEIRGAMTMSFLDQCSSEWFEGIPDPTVFSLPIGEVYDNFDAVKNTPIQERYRSGACSPAIEIVDKTLQKEMQINFEKGNVEFSGTYLVNLQTDQSGEVTGIRLTKSDRIR